jgi:hypothetical protein
MDWNVAQKSPALQAQSPEFKPQSHQEKKKKTLSFPPHICKTPFLLLI